KEKKAQKTNASDTASQKADNLATQEPSIRNDDADEPTGAELCLHPFMLINDLGLTFGRVDILNRDPLESVNFERWSQTPIWKKDEGCIGNLPKSLTGSL